jgi:uncharacterized protein (TIGR04255 family)
MPSELSRVIGGFGLVAEGVESETKMPFILRSAVIAPPPLIDHVSIQLDVDAYWDIDIPARIDEMWAGMERLRSAKNAIFEKSITQELRKLFE